MARWATQDLDAALDHLAAQPEDSLKELLSRWSDIATLDPMKALTWSRDHLQGELRDDALSSTLGFVASEDTMAAVAAFESIESEPARQDAARRMIELWPKEKALEAYQWWRELPEALKTEQGVQELRAAAISQDLDVSLRLAQQSSQHQEAEHWARALVTHFAYTSVEEGLAWAQGIEDSGWRRRLTWGLAAQ